LLLIVDVEDGRIKRVLHDQTTITRLGQGVHADRRFHPEALKRMRECLSEYRRIIDTHQCEKIVAVATSAARDVANGGELLAIGRELGIPIHIISGEREAQLTFKGALCDRASTDGLAVIDVGGGSTEIIHDGGVIRGTSVDVGSVRLMELFVHSDPITVGVMENLRRFAESAFQNAPVPKGPFREVIAVAGTPTTLAGLDQECEFSEERIHGYRMSLTTIERWIGRLAGLTLTEREQLKGMQPKRADVIVAGALILAAAVRVLGQESVTVSTRGVRYGVALAWQEF
jgi:exopolyphosphatase/guanosine-5'-triphosphate,3'-diphosphate pyrophosphatase